MMVAIIIIIGFFLLAGVYSTFRYSLFYVRKSKLEDLSRENNKKAIFVLKVLENYEKISFYVRSFNIFLLIIIALLAAVYLCDDISNLIATSSITNSKPVCNISAMIILVLLISILTVLIMELIPRKIAEAKSLRLALYSGFPLTILKFALYLPCLLADNMSSLVMRIFKVKSLEIPEDGYAEEKIIDMVEAGTRTGEFDEAEEELIKSVIEFGDTTASQCMTPRTEVEAINIDDKTENIMKYIRLKGFSRYPVFKDDLDHILGVIYIHDIINLLHDNQLIIIEDLIHPAYFIPDSKPIAELLRELQTRKTHIAIVLDEFGGTAGIITIEDILEEIVGEIHDEYDKEEIEFRKLSSSKSEVLARMEVDDFNKAFNCELPEEDADTIGGLIFTHLGELPKRNQKVVIKDIEFEITILNGNRIEKVIAKKLSK